jgi:hypothetical protein
MSDSTKALLGGLVASITIIGSLLVVSDCSKVVSRYTAETIENCVRSGGTWLTTNGVTNEGICSRPKQ